MATAFYRATTNDEDRPRNAGQPTMNSRLTGEPFSMKLMVILCAVACSVLNAAGDERRDERADLFVGCYNLELGRWTRLWLFPATPADYQIPPAAFQLDRTPADQREPDRLQIRPNRLINRRASRLDGWILAPDGSNAVYIVWTDGFTGVSLHLKPERTRKRLEGAATAFTDARGLLPFPSARAVAVRTTCGSISPQTK